jgi:hypothetical protein
MAKNLHSASAPEVQVATSRRNSEITSRTGQGATRRVKKTDAAPTSRDIAAESAQIYPDTFDTPPTPDEIATEAYFIYCERGCYDGRAMEDWLEAERRLSARRTANTNESSEP